MTLETSLKGKMAIVFGASKGIGRAVAMGLAEEGATVVVVARSEDKLMELVAQMPGGGHRFLTVDLGKPSEIEKFISSERALFEKTDILVLNSGGPASGPILDAKPETFTQALTQHVLAAQLLAQAVAPGMKSRKWGRILNIISTSVKQPIPGLGVSNTIRAAVASWAKTLAFELAPFGITVNSVLPGYTKTERLESLAQAAAERRKVSVTDIEREWKAVTPMGRFGEASEIAAAAVFLVSPSASFITGVALPVDGGRVSAI